ncbi:UNVERIFIED_CONTAM: hypothetical protein GTU68_039041, partial [Idotea baltica]|nr:hypothetical protein [Idotea baltica]
VIDADGFRLGIGIILTNNAGQVLWARRVNQDAWQFPQGGMDPDETPEESMFRELHEEIGLTSENVRILSCTQEWLKYRLPQKMLRTHSFPLCIGQKQKWFLLRLVTNEQLIRMDSYHKPEFDNWCWVDYWYPLEQVVLFKQEVYRKALTELASHLFS